MMYEIVRFYSERNKRAEVIKTVETEKEAQQWCSRQDTWEEGKWYDGYRRIKTAQ